MCCCKHQRQACRGWECNGEQCIEVHLHAPRTVPAYLPTSLYLIQGLPLETYVAAYKYGSVVIFNGREREQEVLKLCQECCSEPTKQNYTEGKACVPGIFLLHLCPTCRLHHLQSQSYLCGSWQQHYLSSNGIKHQAPPVEDAGACGSMMSGTCSLQPHASVS